MALKWFFSPKTGAKESEANNHHSKRLERSLPNSTPHEVEPPMTTKAEISEHNTGTQHVEDYYSGSSRNSSEAMPSSVVVGVEENASTVSEMDERTESSEEETESSNDFRSYCEKVRSGRPSPVKVESSSSSSSKKKKKKNECAKSPRDPSKRIPVSLSPSASCRITGDQKRPKNRRSAEDEVVGCDSTTIPSGSMGNGTGASNSNKSSDRCPKLPHRKVSMSPEEIKRSQNSKEKKKKKKKTKKTTATDQHSRSNSSKEQQIPEPSGPTFSPELLQSYVDQLQTRRKKKELVRSIRGKRAEEEDTKRKQLSNQEMDEYLTIIKEVRMAKRQAKSRAMQEAMALQRADFLARLIHVSETENNAAKPITPSPNARI